MNFVVLAPLHGCQKVVSEAARQLGVTIRWAGDMDQFLLYLAAHQETFGILATKHRGQLVDKVVRVRAARLDHLLYALFLNESANHSDIAAALNAGADQAEIWPLDPVVLAAQVRAIKNRTRPKDEAMFAFGEVVFDVVSGTLATGDKAVGLTKVEILFLSALCEAPDRLITRSQMMSIIYAGEPSPPDEKILDVYLCKLRKKLKALTEKNHLTRVWAQGFRLSPDGIAPRFSRTGQLLTETA